MPLIAAEALDALLPQTQCGQCGYKGCLPYAEAMAAGAAKINRCPPGGVAVIEDLARLLGQAPQPLDATCGVTQAPAVALIDERWCIGCTLCIQACPVDAIVGTAKVMHTVIAAECTGCELCIPPCPVDCIQMLPVTNDTTPADRSAQARSRYQARNQRLERQNLERVHQQKARSATPDAPLSAHADKKQAAIKRAVERAAARVVARTESN